MQKFPKIGLINSLNNNKNIFFQIMTLNDEKILKNFIKFAFCFMNLLYHKIKQKI